MYGTVNTSWITLNRACNLDCEWCYAKNAKIDEMNISDAIEILHFLKTINVSNVTLIGGEPTIYKDLIPLLNMARDNNIHAGIVTNGIALKNKEYLERLIDAGLNGIGLSCKGYNRDSFIQTTGKDMYFDVLKAISNLSETGVPFSVAFVLTKDNIRHIYKGINDVVAAGAKNVRLSFCYDFDACRSSVSALDNPFELAKEFQNCYKEIELASHGNLNLFQSLPLCVWDKDFILELESKNQISSVCQLLRKSGLIFDCDLSIIPCNAMYDYKIGEFKESFYDADSFNDYWNSQKIITFYNKLRAVPDLECTTCQLYKKCAGGCVSNWFNYSFNDLKKMKGEL